MIGFENVECFNILIFILKACIFYLCVGLISLKWKYLDYIVSQDLQLEELKQQVSTLKCQNEQLQTAVTQQVSQIQQHKDQYNLLKVQLGEYGVQVTLSSAGPTDSLWWTLKLERNAEWLVIQRF